MTNFDSVYRGKKVLITGNTGFKGSWLASWLVEVGADVIGMSDMVPTSPSNFEVCDLEHSVRQFWVDVTNLDEVKRVIEASQPDFIFHLAAQALVYPAYADPVKTITTNALGTVNILEALRSLSAPIVAILITSDKAYDNVEWVWGYKESDRLGGDDPYSASKGMAELAIKSYVKSYFDSPSTGVRLAVARAGNVIGGGDWAENRIVPDCMEAWSLGQAVDIRKPNATRPWQHVLEPLSGYLHLGCELAKTASLHGEAFNFGPPADQSYSVRQLIEQMRYSWDNVKWNDISANDLHLHEAGLLKLNCDKALFHLNWLPVMNFEETVDMTVTWYRNYYQNGGASMQQNTVNQVREFERLAKERSIVWAQ